MDMSDDYDVWPMSEFFLDFLKVTVVYVTTRILMFMNLTYQRGFFCHDSTIMVSPRNIPRFSRTIYFLSRFLNVLLIFLAERYRSNKNNKNNKKIILWRRHVPLWVYKVYSGILSFCLGNFAINLTVVILKDCVGELRPYFYQTCRPDVNCSLPENQGIYHWNFKCTNPDVPSNFRWSFPSGHASIVTYCACFFALYSKKRLATLAHTPLTYFVYCCQFFLIFFVIFMCSVQILSRGHHGFDVWVGCAIGIVFALLSCRKFSNRSAVQYL